MKNNYNKDYMLLTCSSCGKLTDHTYGERWNCNQGYIIKWGEHLCYDCASKREGFKTLTEINAERSQS